MSLDICPLKRPAKWLKTAIFISSMCCLISFIELPADANDCARNRIFKNEKAQDLIFVLKESSLINKKVWTDETLEVSAGTLDCIKWEESIYDCHVRPQPERMYRQGNLLMSKLLWNALKSVGVLSDSGSGQQRGLSVEKIHCVDNNTAANTKNNPRCEITADWENCHH